MPAHSHAMRWNQTQKNMNRAHIIVMYHSTSQLLYCIKCCKEMLENALQGNGSSHATRVWLTGKTEPGDVRLGRRMSDSWVNIVAYLPAAGFTFMSVFTGNSIAWKKRTRTYPTHMIDQNDTQSEILASRTVSPAYYPSLLRSLNSSLVRQSRLRASVLRTIYLFLSVAP